MPPSSRSAATFRLMRSRFVAGAALTCATVGVAALVAPQAQAATRPTKWGVTKTTTSTTKTTTTSTSTLLPLPSGQSVVGGLLSGVAGTFDTVLTGWTAYGPTSVLQTLLSGHNALGALSVTSAGPWTGATSPTFAVTPGVRYSATGWFRGASAGHSVGLALQFRDASGAVISDGNQIGQPSTDTTSGWTQGSPVIGFAPSGAVTGDVVFLDYDGAAGDVQLLDDVSVNSISGSATKIAGPLTTSGNKVKDALGRVVTFRGIDVDGLQYSNTANVTTSEVTVAQSWGANFIRLPLAENYVLPQDCLYDSTYLSKVDAMVNAATSAGIFVMLDLHTNALTACAAPQQQSMPDANAKTFWTTVAQRYKNNPLVGFDLYNEPHDISDAVWRSGGTVTSSGVTYSAPGMQTLYNTVRATGATNLVFASGTNWATQFPTTAPLTGTSNLIYAAHAYTCPSGLPSSGASCTTGPDGTIYDPSGLLSHFASAATTVPVMVTEFGFPDKNDGRYITNVQGYASSHGFVGWDVYAFDNSTGGLFDLWKNTGSVIDPSASGMAVMAGMQAD